MKPSRAGATALLALVSATTLTACGGVGAKLTFNDVEKVKVTDIAITGDSGDVLVRTAAIAETRINRVVHRNSDPGQAYQLDGTTLNVNTSCGPNCSVSWEIVAPEGVKIRANMSSGDIGLTGIGAADVVLDSGDIMVSQAKGDLKLRADSGDIQVTDVTGKITARADSGDVSALEVAGGPFAMSADSGNVRVKLAQPASVTATADSGDVEVMVPEGRYDVQVDARSGEQSQTNVTEDSSSPYKIKIDADSGDASVIGTGMPQAPAAPTAPAAPSPN